MPVAPRRAKQGSPTAARQLLPRATVGLRCIECGTCLGKLDINTGQLASELFRLRREHATEKHGWSR